MSDCRIQLPSACVRRGLTLLEFMLSIMITALIAVTMGMMMSAVARTVEADKHGRETIVRSQALNVRLSSYITPSLCVLDASAQPESIVVWLEDSRVSDTVHLTEIRWIERDTDTAAVVVHYVKFPDGMSQIEKDTLDVEVPLAGADWWGVLATMEVLGYTATTKLCDGVESFNIAHSTATTQSRKIVTCTMTLAPEFGGDTTVLVASVREYKEPAS